MRGSKAALSLSQERVGRKSAAPSAARFHATIATGWLAPPRDPAALADAIGQALRLAPAERAAFARRAIAHVAAGYTRDAMCAKTIDVYEELLFPEPAAASERRPVAIVA